MTSISGSRTPPSLTGTSNTGTTGGTGGTGGTDGANESGATTGTEGTSETKGAEGTGGTQNETGVSATQDGFETAPTTGKAGNLSAFDQKMQQANNRFEQKVNDALNLDAMSLARGETPWKQGDPLTDDQQKKLQGATLDYVKRVPIGAFSPAIQDGIKGALSKVGVDVDDIGSKSIDDLGGVAGDVLGDKAKEIADNFKSNSPAGYYGVLAGGVAAVGSYGYLKGSKALDDIGLKPEIKHGLFNKHVELKARGHWEPKFENPSLDLGVRVQHRFADNSRLWAETNLSTDTGMKDVAGGFSMSRPDLGLSLGAQVRHNFMEDRTTGSLGLRYQPNQNLDVGLSGAFDTQGQSYVGVGVRWRF